MKALPRLLYPKKKSILLPQYKFKCGLEIHCQLKTRHKLFSASKHTFNEPPNTTVSYFDAALPGTIPETNPEAVLLAVIAGVAFNCDINPRSTFDRKHYFYGDQPLGYQITQHYNPICKGGYLRLFKDYDDILQSEKTITFDQIQLEQDTGKSIHVAQGLSDIYPRGCAKIDLNRANVPLIEAVTNPDFEDFRQVLAFVRKFQSVVKFLGVSSGEMETGALRVDANISVNGGNRVEIKNLSSGNAVVQALESEYKRQVEVLKNGGVIGQETRGWDGVKTTKLRDKEAAVDYRYMPDPELGPISLDATVPEAIKQKYVSSLPDDVFRKLTNKPYSLRVKDVRLLLSERYPGLLEYYNRLFHLTTESFGIAAKYPGNFLLHELIGEFTKAEMEFSVDLFPPERLADILKALHEKRLTGTSAKLLMKYLVQNIQDNDVRTKLVDSLIDEFELEASDDDVGELLDSILEQHPQIVANLKAGKKMGSLQYLVGQAMRATQGKIRAKEFEKGFKEKIWGQ